MDEDLKKLQQQFLEEIRRGNQQLSDAVNQVLGVSDLLEDIYQNPPDQNDYFENIRNSQSSFIFPREDSSDLNSEDNETLQSFLNVLESFSQSPSGQLSINSDNDDNDDLILRIRDLVSELVPDPSVNPAIFEGSSQTLRQFAQSPGGIVYSRSEITYDDIDDETVSRARESGIIPASDINIPVDKGFVRSTSGLLYPPSSFKSDDDDIDGETISRAQASGIIPAADINILNDERFTRNPPRLLYDLSNFGEEGSETISRARSAGISLPSDINVNPKILSGMGIYGGEEEFEQSPSGIFYRRGSYFGFNDNDANRDDDPLDPQIASNIAGRPMNFEKRESGIYVPTGPSKYGESDSNFTDYNDQPSAMQRTLADVARLRTSDLGVAAREAIDPAQKINVAEVRALSGRIKTATDNIKSLDRNRDTEKYFQDVEQIIGGFGGRAEINALYNRAQQNRIEMLNLQESGPLTPEDSERYSVLSEQTAVIEKLVAALNNAAGITESSAEKQSKNIAGLISSVVGALGIQQFMMMRMVQQPFQYITQPTLGAMGTTGMMGEALSGAYGAQEQVLQSYREMSANTGFGLGAAVAGGIGTLASKSLVGGAIAASLGSIAGGALGIAFKDPLADFLASGMEDTAFEMELSRRVLDPQRYTQDFFMPTLQARMAFGLGQGGESAASQLAGMASEGAQSMGYDAVVTGQVMGQYLSTLGPSILPSTQEEASDLIDTTAQLEAFGVSKDQVFSVMSSISRAGSEDYESSLGRLLLATSEDGEITNYTANVLVPALMQVVESRSIQNIAKSSEEVQKETAGLFSFFKNSDTNLGKMLAANPEAMNQVFGMLNQVGESALQDPALMLLLNRMGVSFQDVVTGDPRALMMPLQGFANVAQYDAEGNIDLNSAQSISSIVGFLTMSGVGVNTGSFNLAAQMMEALQREDFTEAEMLSEEIYGQTPESILQQLVERLDEIAGTDGGASMRDVVNQANTFYGLMEEHLDDMRDLQSTMSDVLSNSEAMSDMIKNAALDMVEEMINIVKLENVSNDTMASYLSLASGGVINAENLNIPLLASNVLGVEEKYVTTAEDERTYLIRALRYLFDRENPGTILESRFGENYQDYVGMPTSPVSSGESGSSSSNMDIQGYPIGFNPEGYGGFGEAGFGPNSTPTGATQGYPIGFNPEGYGGFGEAGFGPNSTPTGATQGYPIGFNPEGYGGFGNGTFGPFSLPFMTSDTKFTIEGYGGFLGHQGPVGIYNFGFPVEREGEERATEYAIGGYTGSGGRTDPVGVVHGGEYVISDNRVMGNRNTLERMQSGENFDEESPMSSVITNSGETIRVTLEFSNTNPEQIIDAARMSAKQMLLEERLL